MALTYCFIMKGGQNENAQLLNQINGLKWSILCANIYQTVIQGPLIKQKKQKNGAEVV